MSKTVYTIGHSTHAIERFLMLLQQHAVSAVADVRSSPYSRVNPQFNREPLKQALKDVDITYVFLGKELGARSEDPACYKDNKVSYERLAATTEFQAGLERVKEGASRFRLALMCAEKEPLDCHRTILVSRHLRELGLPVRHILADGSVEDHEGAMVRLVRKLGLPENDMFRSAEEIQQEAYDLQGERIAYERPAHAGHDGPKAGRQA